MFLQQIELQTANGDHDSLSSSSTATVTSTDTLSTDSSSSSSYLFSSYFSLPTVASTTTSFHDSRSVLIDVYSCALVTYGIAANNGECVCVFVRVCVCACVCISMSLQYHSTLAPCLCSLSASTTIQPSSHIHCISRIIIQIPLLYRLGVSSKIPH